MNTTALKNFDTKRFMVVIHQCAEGGYSAEVPTLPGCFSQGETLDEIYGNIQEAITGYLETLADTEDTHADIEISNPIYAEIAVSA